MKIDIHTHNSLESSRNKRIYNLDFPAEFLPFGLSSIGLHPYKAPLFSDELISQIRTHLVSRSFSAIGECGLDASIDVDFGLQCKVFEAHIALSEEFSLPLIIHSVKANAEILKFKKLHQPKQAWIIHQFSGSEHEALNFLKESNIYLSFGKLLYQSSARVNQYFAKLPLDRIFLETDNSNLRIEDVYKEAAKRLNLPISDLEIRLEQNFKKAFNQSLTD